MTACISCSARLPSVENLIIDREVYAALRAVRSQESAPLGMESERVLGLALAVGPVVAGHAAVPFPILALHPHAVRLGLHARERVDHVVERGAEAATVVVSTAGRAALCWIRAARRRRG